MFIFVFFLSNYKIRLISCSDLNMCFIVIYRNEYFSFVNLSNIHVCSLFLLYIYTGIVYVYFTDIRKSNHMCMPASKMILNSVCAKNLPAPPLPPSLRPQAYLPNSKSLWTPEGIHEYQTWFWLIYFKSYLSTYVWIYTQLQFIRFEKIMQINKHATHYKYLNFFLAKYFFFIFTSTITFYTWQ